MAAAGDESIGDSLQKGLNLSRETDIQQQDPMATQHEHLITEIEESTEGHLSTALRAVYDGASPDKFMDRLDVRIKGHDKEIERMCNYHYQGFIESIRSLLQVRGQVESIKDEIQSTNTKLQMSGSLLLTKGDELVKCRKTQQNIGKAVETMSLCLPVLETYGKLKDQMKCKRYYPALKTLEQLEHTYLPRVSKYRFSQVMCETIPKLRDSIKDASMSDLKDFLENIRKHSDRIGEIAMKHAAEQNNMDPALAERKGKKRKAPAPPNPFTSEVEDGDSTNPFDEDEDKADNMTIDTEEVNDFKPMLIKESWIDIDVGGLSAQDLIDFSPVYRCLHIYSVLGAREQFEGYYRKQRRKQARLALQPPPNLTKREEDNHSQDRAKRLVENQGYDPSPSETLEGYKKYFHDIVGFFVVEDHILNTTTGLVNRTYIDELWDMALSKIVAVLRTHSSFCTDASLMLQIKNLIMLFSHTLRGYGFTVSQLYDLLLEIRDQYSEILMKKWVAVFNYIFDEDNYSPIMASDEKEYKETIDVYPFKDPQLEQESYPRAFPFSNMVPQVYCEVKQYIYACLKFSEDLHLSHTEIDDMIRKLANVLLTRTLSGCLSSLIKKPNLGLLQLIQISINMNYLEKSCVYLEDFISNITGSEKENMYVSKLQGTSMFKDARSEAEEQIYKQINDKIDNFMEDSTYDWTMQDAKGHASDHITSMILFLRSTFQSFTNLPEKVAQTACMSACKHIAACLTQQLVNNEVTSLTIGALQQINLDLMQCEIFANSEPVPGFNDGTLQLAFTDLRQMLDLFIGWDWTTFFADYGKPGSKYLRVNPSNAIILLEKLTNADKKKNNLLTTFKRNERDKKKLNDTILRQLRQLMNGDMQNTV